MSKFEKLVIWQKAVDLLDAVNQLAKAFLKDEIFVMTSQIKRVADSVALNIAFRSDIEVVSCFTCTKA